MTSVCGRYVLVYNGEIYNLDALRKGVEGASDGWAWRGHSDTEVLLGLFTSVGVEAALAQLDGMFAFAVFDRYEQAVFLARDRFGEKPLSYGLVDGVLAFASEVRPLSRVLGLGRGDIAPEALAALIEFQTIPAPYSVYSRVQKLPAGSWVRFSREDCEAGTLPEPARYWDPADVAAAAAANPFKGSFNDAVDACEALMLESVRSRMMADVPLGTMLSSGVDSALVTALAQKAAVNPVRSYTIDVEGEGFNEGNLAARIAERLGTAHTTIPVGIYDCLNAAKSMHRIYDEPFADSSQIVTYILAREIRKDVTVALSGDGGDELFAGYTRHFAGPRLWLRMQQVPKVARSLVRGAASAIGEARAASGLSWAASRAGYQSTGETVGRIQKAIRSIGARNPGELYDGLLKGARHGLTHSPHGLPSAYIPLQRADGSEAVMRSMLLADVQRYLPETIMTKVDRASMAVSLEARAPFLNASLLSLAWSLPDEFLVAHGRGKAVTRALAARHVGTEIMTSPKRGFAVPMDAWLRGPLRSWGSDLLGSQTAKTFDALDLPATMRLWNQHQSGRIGAAGQLWPVLSFLAWLEREA
jgi:asparagine synthase (glutamine-hydrolysing)